LEQSDATLPRFFRMASRPYSLLYLPCFYFLLAANVAFFGSFEVLPKFFAISLLFAVPNLTQMEAPEF
jgi:hypothetical protein